MTEAHHRSGHVAGKKAFCGNRDQRAVPSERRRLHDFFGAHMGAPVMASRSGAGPAPTYDKNQRRGPYHRPRLLLDSRPFFPLKLTLIISPKISLAEWVRSLRPDVVTLCFRMTTRPWRRSARLKKISSAANRRSSKPPTRSNASRVQKTKHPAASFNRANHHSIVASTTGA